MAKKPTDADSSRFQYKGQADVSPTSTGLIVRVKDGESAAWERFMKLYTPLIRHWCRKPGGGALTRQDRQDITQEVLRKASQSVGEFDERREGRSLRAWLRTITANAIADHLEFAEKRRGVNHLMSDTGHFKYPPQKPIELEIEEEPETEKILLLRQILKIVEPEFSKRDFEIVGLFINAEKTSAEVAEIMDMKPDTVRRIKNRILVRIRQEYESLGLGDEMPTGK